MKLENITIKPEKPAKITWSNIKGYVQGNIRMGFYDSLPDYIKEQIEWRKEKAKDCLENKACIYCGCDTPALFFEDRGCKDPVRNCYPKMMSKKEWNKFKNNKL